MVTKGDTLWKRQRLLASKVKEAYRNSVKSGPFSVRSVAWRKKPFTVRVGHFLFHKKRLLKTGEDI